MHKQGRACSGACLKTGNRKICHARSHETPWALGPHCFARVQGTSAGL